MFQGETSITVDDKGRLAIPAVYRDAVAEQGNRLVFTYNPYENGSLFIYPVAVYEKVREQVAKLPNSSNKHRQLQRKLIGSAAVVDVDGSGRISIPQSMRLTLGIEKKTILLGMDDRFELWTEKAHQAQIEQTVGDDITPEMLELRI
ncbi:division/cell wall cluster transcriptional repressor MraZ [Lysobacter soyae]|jgi:MraZ protein|uniref:Transcriptional regulator MraZ n=1 Tax=Lysobacter soyae TaxID=2764185 RepID=A0ABX8WPN0_9GAMM|nr:division/cell wall cluster transcriptional repressor MraZ [Lysobacter sp. CJ11]QYR52684.1 division/cell wall cluster transcriptional repressor MraZ [Lysobacter sp. CJ11]